MTTLYSAKGMKTSPTSDWIAVADQESESETQSSAIRCPSLQQYLQEQYQTLERERLTRSFREKHPVTFIPTTWYVAQVKYTSLGRWYDSGFLTDQSLSRWTGPHEAVRLLSINVVEIKWMKGAKDLM